MSFQFAGQARKRKADCKIDQRHQAKYEKWLEGGVGQYLRGSDQFVVTEDRRKSGALDELHKETDGWRDGDADGLRQDHQSQLGNVVEPEASAAVPLAARDGLNGTAPDVGEVSAGIEG